MAPARALRMAGPALLVVAALLAALWALAYGGGAAPLPLGDPGPFVRWGLPLITMVVNLSAAGLCGTLVTALFALRADEKPFELALSVASLSAAIFTVAAAATGFLTFVLTFNPTVGLDNTFGGQLGTWLTTTEAGLTWLITTLAGAVLTVLTFAVRGWTSTLLVAIAALAALIPMATQGHSGDLASHNIAVTAMVLHMAGAAVWVGGLVLLVIVRPLLDRDRMADVLGRYSSIAIVAFVVVAVSGVARAVIGLGDLNDLFDSGYGTLVLVKASALVLLGLLGTVYRTRLISQVRQDAASRRFWRFVLVELVIMGIASGAAVALARTPPPAGAQVPLAETPAEILTGSPLPPELTMARWFTQWDIDLLWAVLCAFGAFFYLAGVWRLHRRGDRWPIYRTVFWILGLVLLAWVTNGPLNAYQDYLFSVHMMGHMLLTMAIPMLLVPGAPVTLALRAIQKRHDGTRGAREWIMWAVHSPFARVITNPIVAAVIFAASLWVFYFSDLLRWAMYDHLGHEWMIVHFLISGYLFVQSLIGIDPVPSRLPYALRLVILILVMATHAFFGITIMMHSGLMVAEWFGSMGRTWGATPLADQYVGGGIAWSVGEIPTLILAVIVGISWARDDDRVQKRRDRHADRTGDAELVEYNARLAALAERDAHAADREAHLGSS
ncbi:copper transporter [Microbacterium protaetiae]|uniref:Copper transporter n=1 Tax=Microbacterium protaetiae TaxID=2509458 RepID=A0A4P6EGZ8_9MICO|nr:cytochrome c oxidase assembly protein [Microbacterium protaetiae]QAY61732.1 copper transporter [Microbacterium protaetiae]